MQKLFMLIGLPGSGKSTIAKDLSLEENAVIFSSDDLRKELYGDEACQEDSANVFEILHKRIYEAIESGNNIIYDATNISSKRRKAFLQTLNKYFIDKIAVFIATPYDECLRRNLIRNRVVPEYAIKRMYMNFNVPCLQEGFTSVKVIYPKTLQFIDPFWLVNSYKNIPHDNPHHLETIGDHMYLAYNYLVENYDKICDINDRLMYATLLHDIGKPFTKVFCDRNGNPTDIAHYYNHNNVGAYDVFFTNIPEDIKLDVSLLIQYHMQYYISWKQSEKAMSKDKAFLGFKFVSLLDILHECDLAAHMN